MTLAPRIEVFTQLSCNALHAQHSAGQLPSLTFLPTNSSHSLWPNTDASFYFSLDALGPHLDPGRRQYDSILLPSTVSAAGSDDDDDDEDPRRLPSNQCLGNPAVQAGAARLQAMMTVTMGFLSALTTGWWGHFGERHGRTKVLAGATFGLFLTCVRQYNFLFYWLIFFSAISHLSWYPHLVRFSHRMATNSFSSPP